jgi:hypothetical protein
LIRVAGYAASSVFFEVCFYRQRRPTYCFIALGYFALYETNWINRLHRNLSFEINWPSSSVGVGILKCHEAFLIGAVRMVSVLDLAHDGNVPVHVRGLEKQAAEKVLDLSSSHIKPYPSNQTSLDPTHV